jgi:PrtD family type I secretion system ABC transporter
LSRSPKITAARADRQQTTGRGLDALLAGAGPEIKVTPRAARADDSAAKAAAPMPAHSPPVEPAAAQSSPERPPIPSKPAAKERDAGIRSQLPHLSESVRGKLGSFLADKDKAPAPEAVLPVAPPRPPRPEQGADGGAGLLPGQSELLSAILLSRRPFMALAGFSFVINILMLAGPLFMLQVYDRVMTSGSMPTLLVLTLITAGLYGIIGMLELVRSRVVVRIGVEIDERLGNRIFQASLKRSIASRGASPSALRELDNLRQFLAGQGPMTFFDAPWTPVYLLVVFLTHWMLGIVATLGAALLLIVAWASERTSRGPLTEAGKAAARSFELAESAGRNAEAITAMGMLGDYRSRWRKTNAEAMSWALLAADRLGSMSALSKTLRLLWQSLMLAAGAALALRGEISAGAIIAGTIIFGRALAPVEQIIGHWRASLKALESYHKLDELLSREPPPPRRTALPAPKGKLEVSQLRVAAPEGRHLILQNLNFGVAPGQMLAVIGPSASGKSTLARTIVGLWPAVGGTIRLDGARLDQWNAEDLGRHVGYLPQDVELFAGTVKENIARFRDDAQDEDVIAAAAAAHAHEMILALPQGYETQLGAFGTHLSAGQRQRIALARALYGNPPLVVLDEPNANLDRNGDEALSRAVDGMRARGQAVVLVSHRVQAIGKADLLLYVDRGTQRAFGTREDVMKLFQNTPFPHRRTDDQVSFPEGQSGAAGQRPQPAPPKPQDQASSRP